MSVAPAILYLHGFCSSPASWKARLLADVFDARGLGKRFFCPALSHVPQEAIAQANRYADTDTVKQAIGSTQLHKIVVVYKGMEMRVCEEL